jgi:hypothetical protein
VASSSHGSDNPNANLHQPRYALRSDPQGHTSDFRDNLRNSFHRPKLNFLRYDGETDPLPWLNRCESYFRGTRTMAAEQVWLASLHMDGVAAEWYYALERDYNVLSWTRFTEFVNLRFGSPIRSNPLGGLKELHRTGHGRGISTAISLASVPLQGTLA